MLVIYCTLLYLLLWQRLSVVSLISLLFLLLLVVAVDAVFVFVIIILVSYSMALCRFHSSAPSASFCCLRLLDVNLHLYNIP